MNVSRLSVIDVSASAAPVDPPAGITPDQLALSALQTLAAPSVAVIRLYAQAMQSAGSQAPAIDVEGLHQLRVASRRLRALLWAYAPLLDTDERADADKRLKALADIAGHTRDWDILLTQLPANKHAKKRTLPTSRKRTERLRRAARAHRETALNASYQALLRFDVDSALSPLLSASPPSLPSPSPFGSASLNAALAPAASEMVSPRDDASVSVAALAAQALPRAAAQVAARAHRVAKAVKKAAKKGQADTVHKPGKRSRKPGRSDRSRESAESSAYDKRVDRVLVSLHRTRIAIKKLRYLSDLFAPVMSLSPKALAKQNDALAELQTRLGKVNDDRASAEMVGREWISGPSAVKRERAAAKSLQTHLRHAAARRARRATGTLKRASRRKLLSPKHWRKVVDVDIGSDGDARQTAPHSTSGILRP